MLLNDPFSVVRGGTAAEFSFSPIESAPVQPGKSFGPCLIGPGPEAEWVIGHWSGQGWYCDNGSPVSPLLWAPLPSISEVLASARPVTLAGAIAVLEQLSKDENQSYPEIIRNVIVFLRRLQEQDATEHAGK